MNKIQKLRESHMSSVIRKMALTGEKYYRSMNDIMSRKMYIYTDEGIVEDVYKANNLIATAYCKLLVDQLVNYLIGKKPTAPIEGNKFYKQLKDVATKARSNGQQWVQGYVENGEFKTKLIPTTEIMPVYENDKLVKVYRFITIDDKPVTIEYTKDEVIYYDGKGEEISRSGNLTWNVIEGANETTEGGSLGIVPFIRMKANNVCTYELEPVKSLIDSYDKTISDFANNLEDFQDVTWILKGYNGGNLADFVRQVKQVKSIPVGEGGDARPETIDIPHEARMKMLEQTENLIFKFGFGVNLDSLSGGSLTNVAIKSQFANLDMKANAFSQEVEDYINDYIELNNAFVDKIGGQRYEEEEITFNKTVISNEVELLEANAKQAGFISNETRWDNHPWTDAEIETARMAQTLIIEEGDNDGQEE